MKKSILLLSALLLATLLNAQSLEEIVKKYTVANKLDKLSAISTVKIAGKMSMMGIEMPMELWMKNPDKLLQVLSYNGQEIVTAIDGTKGYAINPMAGSPTPKEIPISEVENLKKSLVFYNYLEAYLKKGKLTLDGNGNVGDKPAFKLKILMDGGTIVLAYIDKSSFLMVKATINSISDGVDVVAEVIYSDFKDNSGVFLPMKQITTTARGGFEMIYDKVEVNIPMEDKLFRLK
jgi:hypothetical protein